MKYFLDTEFIEDGKTIELLSIGLVAEDGREFYQELDGVDDSLANDFVKKHVLPKLGQRGESTTVPKSRVYVRDQLVQFVHDDEPEFVADCASYDWIALCQLFGTMMDLPEGWPYFCLDLRQYMAHKGIESRGLPAYPENQHHALADARWLRQAWKMVELSHDRHGLHSVYYEEEEGVLVVEVKEGAHVQILGTDSGIRLSASSSAPLPSIEIIAERSQLAPQLVGV